MHCESLFDSPIQFANKDAFFTSSLIHNALTCPSCKKTTGCNKNNMIFHAEDEGFVGKDT